MAAQLGSHGHAGRRRAFVLVDQETAKGVFPSWDDAEAFADENNLSLDHLLEFETKSDHPDHLHLMAARWDGDWKFVGEWSKFAPYWESAPSQVRLDHYQVKGSKFVIFRQCEFTWRPGLLQTINPMAPDEALRFADQSTKKPPTPTPDQHPKISPLKPVDRSGETNQKKPPEPPKEGQSPLISDPEPPVESIPAKPKLTTTPYDSNVAKKKGETDASRDSSGDQKPRISFQKKKPLRLKSQKAGPKPIPEFKPPPPPVDALDAPSSVELAQAQLAAAQGSTSEAGDTGGKPKRVWPLRVLLPIFAIFLCWGGGIYWVFKPEPTAQNIISQITTLARARTLVIEPGQVFFQLAVDPINQQRWVQSLQLDPILETEPIKIPTYHALDTWQKSSGFVRPPYAAVEVREWWNLRVRTIRYGFYHRWDDGSILILDLESDLLIGWSEAARLTDLLN